MIEMGDHDGAQRLITNLQSTLLFGNKLQLDLSKKHTRITNAPLEFKLEDGSNSVKDYVSDWRLNRFNTKEMARKNRILAPTKVIHFYGIPKDMTERDIENLFGEYCAPAPNKIKFVESKKEREVGNGEERSGVGLAYFNSVEVFITINIIDKDPNNIVRMLLRLLCWSIIETSVGRWLNSASLQPRIKCSGDKVEVIILKII